jgi:hypothetical protein
MKNRSRLTIFTTIFSVAACFGLAFGAAGPESPDPIPFPVNSNTADGYRALENSDNAFNSGFGWFSLFNNTDAFYNSGFGAATLFFNNGGSNTAVGAAALFFNTTGGDNNAVGVNALRDNDSGTFNNAHGRGALFANFDGGQNNAFGDLALTSNVSGSFNTAIGDDALFSVTGDSNVGVGDEAGNSIVDGSNNVCIGTGAGIGIVSASNQVAINVPAAGPFADISNTCFIGSIYNQPVSDAGTAQDTYVDQFNVLGFLPSSRRFKHDITPMDKASEVLYGLKPVTFKYNSDNTGRTQYGVIAEEVAQVAPDLVFRDKDGTVQTVRFEQIGAMLLNEFLKEHKKVQALEATVAQQQKGMEVLTAQLKEQAAQIQKVSAQVEMSKPAPQVVVNKP